MKKTYEIALTFLGPRMSHRLILKEEAKTREQAEQQAIKRARKMTGRRMRVSARVTA